MNELGFDFSISSLFAGLIFGIIGMWAFKEGKRKANHHWIVIAIIMFVYTYFTSSPFLDWGIGALLCYLLYYFKDH